MLVANNAGFLKECVRRIPMVNFVEPASGVCYLTLKGGKGEVRDAAVLAQVAQEAEIGAAIGEIAPEVLTAVIPA